MHKKTAHSNSPAPRLLDEIGATNLTLADAVAEIVANSFDAAVDGEKSTIEVIVDAERVMVLDNGYGMNEAVLVEAVKLGKDMSKVVKRKAGAKGHFGLGMKTACASIGRWWSVRTRPKGENKEYGVVFDLEEWERRPDDPKSWTIEVEEWSPPPADSPLGARTSGTAVTVRKLRGKSPMSGAVTDKLGEAFKPHLAAGDEITVNGVAAAPHEYQFVAGSLVPIDLKFGPNHRYRITGWVAVDRQTHNDGDYGFNIYRSGQLVQTWCQDWIPAHLMTSRIIGEVHMDFIEATFFKQGLQQSDLWRLASAEMKEFLRPLVKASRELSRKGNINKPVQARQIIDDMYAGLGLEPPARDAAVASGSEDPDGHDDDPERPELPRIRVETELLEIEAGLRISLSLVERDMGGRDTPFDYLYHGTELLTVLNTAHPMFEKSKDISQLRLLAISDSIVRYLVAERSMTPLKAADVRGSWMLAAVAAPAKEESQA